MCVHRFLDELGVDEVRQRGAADDKPLRMVKTLVHEMCKCLVGAWLGADSLLANPCAWPRPWGTRCASAW